jgi:predicted helicase
MIVTTSFFHNWIKSCTAKYGHTWEDINKAIDEKHIFNESSFKQCHNKIKGDIFEYICKYTLLLKYDNVYLNQDIPNKIRKKLNMRKQDKGIDIIYENDDGEYIAVQCKWRGGGASKKKQINKKYVTEFLSHLRDRIFR